MAGRQSEGFVYFITAGPRWKSPIKVGWALDPTRRIRELQTGNPRNLKLISSAPGDIGLEQLIHSILREYRLAGEWFRPATEVCLFADEARVRPGGFDSFVTQWITKRHAPGAAASLAREVSICEHELSEFLRGDGINTRSHLRNYEASLSHLRSALEKLSDDLRNAL